LCDLERFSQIQSHFWIMKYYMRYIHMYVVMYICIQQPEDLNTLTSLASLRAFIMKLNIHKFNITKAPSSTKWMVFHYSWLIGTHILMFIVVATKQGSGLCNIVIVSNKFSTLNLRDDSLSLLCIYVFVFFCPFYCHLHTYVCCLHHKRIVQNYRKFSTCTYTYVYYVLT